MSAMRGLLASAAGYAVLAGGVTVALTTPPLSGGTLVGGLLIVTGGVVLVRIGRRWSE